VNLQQANTSSGSGPFYTPPRPRPIDASNRLSGTHRRTAVGFRSTILRPGLRSDERDRDNNNKNELSTTTSASRLDEPGIERRHQLHLSNEDIRASPRLLGYLFGSIAFVVMLVSVVQFYNLEDEAWSQSPEALGNYSLSQFPDETFFHTINGPIYLWKLWASVAVASAGSFLFLSILVVHFDTIFFPRTWFQIFRDGSLAERNLLIGLLVFCVAVLHINTSSFSVGEAQANVFFTSWIVFICTVLTFGVWRHSADLPQLAAKILTHHRETTYNWCWVLIFSLITAGSATDLFFHRTEVTLRLQGEELVLEYGMWMRVLGMVWALVAVCLVALFFNHFWTNTWKLKVSSECRFVLNWRFLEGLLILSLMGVQCWAIISYTGADGVINGLNNTYFGIWGAFFNTGKNEFLSGCW